MHVGQIVHYVSYGTPGGEFKSECRAAIVTDIREDRIISLCVLNPTGMFFHSVCKQNELEFKGGTWHHITRQEIDGFKSNPKD